MLFDYHFWVNAPRPDVDRLSFAFAFIPYHFFSKPLLTGLLRTKPWLYHHTTI